MKSNKLWGRILCSVLSVSMLTSALSFQAFADPLDGADSDVLSQALAVARSNYSEASYLALQDAITAGDAEGIAQAIDGLKDADARQRLEDLVTLVKEKNIGRSYDPTADDQSIVTDESLKALDQEVKSAESLLAQDGATDYQLNQAYTALDTRLLNLTRLSQAKLEAKLSEVKAMSSEGHDAAGWQVLQDQIAAAEAVAADSETSTFRQEQQVRMLDCAVASLQLYDLINTAVAIEQGDYSAATYTSLQDAIRVAKNNVSYSEQSTADKILSYVEKLQAAIDALSTENPVDKSALTDKIAEAKAIAADGYTANSFAYLTQIIELSEAVASDPDKSLTSSEVSKQTTMLKNAVSSLKTPDFEVNCDALFERVLEALPIEQGEYTDSTYKVLKTAITNAQSKLADAKLTQEKADAALEQLDNGIAGLMTLPQKLVADYEQAKAFQQGSYSDLAYSVLQTAANNAEAVVREIQAGAIPSQEEIKYHSTCLANCLSTAMLNNRTNYSNYQAQFDALDASDYSATSYEALQVLLQKIRTVLENPETTSSSSYEEESTMALSTAIYRLKTFFSENGYLAKATHLSDGTYQVNVNIQNADSPENVSMADSVLNHTAVVNIEGDKMTVYVSVNTLDFGGMGLMFGNLKHLYYFNSLKDFYPSVHSCDGEADILFTRSSLSTDTITGAEGFQSYVTAPDLFRATLPYSDSGDVYVQVNVDMMEGLGMSLREGILRFDLANAVPTIFNVDLKVALANATQLSRDNYTPASFTTLQQEITKAQAIYASDASTQEQIDAATAALNDSISSLQEIADKTALNSKLVEAKAIQQGDYTSDSYAELQRVIALSDAVAANLNATAQQVSEAIASLDAAIAGLKTNQNQSTLPNGTYTLPVKLSKLNGDTSMAAGAVKETALLQVKDGKETLTLTFQPMELASFGSTGHLLNGRVFPTFEDYNAYLKDYSNYENYTTAGVVESSYTDLVFGSTTGETMQYPEKVSIPVPTGETYNGKDGFLLFVIVDAMKVFNPGSAVPGAAEVLVKLDYDNAEPVQQPTVDKTALNEALSEALGYNPEDYTVESFTNLQSAIAAAQVVADSDDATQDAVDAQVAALRQAIDALVKAEQPPVVVDKSALNAKLAEIKELDSSQYTEESWNALQSAVAAAQAVAGDPDATQDQVDAQAKALQTAVKSLVEAEQPIVVDKSVLAAKLAEISGLTASNYTAESWAGLQAAVTAAKQVAGDPDATQEQVNAQVTALEIAIANLVEQTETPLDKDNLADGIYSVNIEMIKTNRTEYSMANNAVNHTLKLEVKDGGYTATLDFKGLAIYNQFGYLSKLSYYDKGFTYDKYGNPIGTLQEATVLSHQKDENGDLIVDQYNTVDTPYPDQVSFPLVNKASYEGDYVPLQVVVPIMEAIAAGNGTQNVLMKIDWSSLQKAKEEDFEPEKPEEQSPAVDLTDSATGINVSADKGVFPEGVTLSVSQITAGADYTQAAALLQEIGKKFNLYDVAVLSSDGTSVQPNGKAQISFPIPSGTDGSLLAVYRINDDGTKTLVSGKVTNGSYVVTVNQFGRFAVVEKGSAVAGTGNAGQTTGTPKTGDTLPIASMVAVALTAGAVLLSRKRKGQ